MGLFWWILGAAVVVGLLAQLVPWLVQWARETIRAVFAGVLRGALVLRQLHGRIRAFAWGPQVAGEVRVDPESLPESVREALRAQGYLREDIDV
jgi:hypothetical protein